MSPTRNAPFLISPHPAKQIEPLKSSITNTNLITTNTQTDRRYTLRIEKNDKHMNRNRARMLRGGEGEGHDTSRRAAAADSAAPTITSKNQPCIPTMCVRVCVCVSV